MPSTFVRLVAGVLDHVAYSLGELAHYLQRSGI